MLGMLFFLLLETLFPTQPSLTWSSALPLPLTAFLGFLALLESPRGPCHVSVAQRSPGRWSWACLCLCLAHQRLLLQFGARLWWRLAAGLGKLESLLALRRTTPPQVVGARAHGVHSIC